MNQVSDVAILEEPSALIEQHLHDVLFLYLSLTLTVKSLRQRIVLNTTISLSTLEVFISNPMLFYTCRHADNFTTYGECPSWLHS